MSPLLGEQIEADEVVRLLKDGRPAEIGASGGRRRT